MPAVVARQLEAVAARRRAEIIAEKLAKDPTPSRGASDTLPQLQPRARGHYWTFPAARNHPRCAQRAFERGILKKEKKKERFSLYHPITHLDRGSIMLLAPDRLRLGRQF